MLYANFVHSLLSLLFLLTIDCPSGKKAAVRCGALVSECALIAIVIASRATVVISDNLSDPARRISHVETAPERRVICCRRSSRIEPIAPRRGRAIIFARRVLWENAHPRLLFYEEVRGLVPNRPYPRRLSLRDTRVSARDRFSRYALCENIQISRRIWSSSRYFAERRSRQGENTLEHSLHILS